MSRAVADQVPLVADLPKTPDRQGVDDVHDEELFVHRGAAIAVDHDERGGIPVGQLRSFVQGWASRHTTLQSIASAMGMQLSIAQIEPGSTKAPLVTGARQNLPRIITGDIYYGVLTEKGRRKPLARKCLAFLDRSG